MRGSTSVETFVEALSWENSRSAVPRRLPSRIEALKVCGWSPGIPRRTNGLERPGRRSTSMAQQAIDLAQQTSASSSVVGCRVENPLLPPDAACRSGSSISPPSFQSTTREAAAFIFVGLGVLAGLHHSTSVPAAVPLFLNDIVHRCWSPVSRACHPKRRHDVSGAARWRAGMASGQ
jgi:hypothetical protein